jgi:pyruvate/2-oxoglutarate dehydrogenase complex dihydrolipoamide acyltransferase (E2) component
MAYSAFTAPHISLALHVDMSEASRLRQRVQEPIQHKPGQRLSFTAIIARAVASVLPRHPYLNASEEGVVLRPMMNLTLSTRAQTPCTRFSARATMAARRSATPPGRGSG